MPQSRSLSGFALTCTGLSKQGSNSRLIWMRKTSATSILWLIVPTIEDISLILSSLLLVTTSSSNSLMSSLRWYAMEHLGKTYLTSPSTSRKVIKRYRMLFTSFLSSCFTLRMPRLWHHSSLGTITLEFQSLLLDPPFSWNSSLRPRKMLKSTSEHTTRRLTSQMRKSWLSLVLFSFKMMAP